MSYITSNYRQFGCPELENSKYMMDMEVDSNYQLIDTSSTLDTKALLASTKNAMKSVSTAIIDYKKAVSDAESEFEILITSNKIERTPTLLMKMSEVITQCKKVLKALNDWYINFSNQCYDLITNLSKYQNTITTLNSVKSPELLTMPGFATEPYTKARANMNIFKTFVRSKQLAETLNKKIFAASVLIDSDIELLQQGIIKVNKETINILELLNLIYGLRNTDTNNAINRARNYVSRFVTLPNIMKVGLNTPTPTFSNIDHKKFKEQFLNLNVTKDNVTQIIDALKSSVIYTPNSAKYLDGFLKSLEDKYELIGPLITQFKTHDISVILKENEVTEDASTLFMRMSILETYQKNLLPEDFIEHSQIYNRLKDLKTKAKTLQ